MNIRGLAQHLNLSIGTVSRALNDASDVSTATRRRVIEAAARLGYTPNQSGRSLRRGKTGAVAFILPVTAESGAYGDPFFLSLMGGLQRHLERASYELIVLPVRHDQNELEHLRRSLGRGIADAWLLAEIKRHDERVELLAARQLPFVAFGRTGNPSGYPWLDLDFQQLISNAVSRLIGQGHRRIALITPGLDVNFSSIVIDTYREVLEAAQLTPDEQLIYVGDIDPVACAAATDAFLDLDDPPTAAFAMSENGPVGIYAALRGRGLQPGMDFAVIGSRDTPACMGLDPPLTCFSLDLHALGEKLGSMLIDVITADGVPGCKSGLLWPFRLREGESDFADPSEQ
ncbi:LacI family DNA-binding transcriptional regulator [Sphingobium sp. UBA5915]|uniref:LacI family DNA-binding transcriptional regulator n=1 Tax=Sphingobium sp. UBA5915 TaxID=1947530 RepID=UPI0025FF484D|nr:substrate-binding domain-containing protein [Sphingobium sp. UBA5915]